MSDSATTTCPECKSEQPSSAPFCQNCGLRLRSAATVREALGPLEREKLEDLISGEEPASKKPAPSAPRPARRMVSALSREAEAAAERAQERAQDRAQEQATEKDKSTNTLVEGVRAVQPKTVAMRAVSVEADESREQPVSQPAAPAAASKGGEARFSSWRALFVVFLIFGSVMALSLLTWLHLQSRAEAEQVGAKEYAAPVVVEIEEGPFRRGLSDEAQSFIMQLCHQMMDESGTRCERERLLSGEYPQQTVRMPAFGIDSGPVRNADYQSCVESGHCRPVDFDGCQLWTPRGLQIGVRLPRVLKREERPVVCVDRDRAQEYCHWKGGELPTHNQWEKAARGTEGLLFPWGDFWEVDRANWGELDIMRTSVAGKLDGWAWTSPPGAYPEGKSPFGVFDMAGNVAEWVRGDDELEGHVRGGSWISTPFELRTTARQARDVGATRSDIGFRCVYPR